MPKIHVTGLALHDKGGRCGYVSVSSSCPGETDYVINYVINSNSFSHLTLVDLCAVRTGLRVVGGGGGGENKVLDKEINYKLSKKTRF